MGTYHAAVDATRVCLLAVGSFFIVVGIARSVPAARGPGGRGRSPGFWGTTRPWGWTFS